MQGLPGARAVLAAATWRCSVPRCLPYYSWRSCRVLECGSSGPGGGIRQWLLRLVPGSWWFLLAADSPSPTISTKCRFVLALAFHVFCSTAFFCRGWWRAIGWLDSVIGRRAESGRGEEDFVRISRRPSYKCAYTRTSTCCSSTFSEMWNGVWPIVLWQTVYSFEVRPMGGDRRRGWAKTIFRLVNNPRKGTHSPPFLHTRRCSCP